MKHRTQRGFTLLEVLAVIVIILVIAGWIVTAARSSQVKASRARALAEITTMKMGCEAYKTEFGSYPRSETVTEMVTGSDPPIDPLKDGNPTTDTYKNSSAFLYIALSGDDDRDGKLKDPERSKGFTDFFSTPGMINGSKDPQGRIAKVNYLQDPFGYSYGYCTAGAKLEDDFKAEAIAKGNKAQRSDKTFGINPDYDLWSTGGLITPGVPKDEDRAVWIKNW